MFNVHKPTQCEFNECTYTMYIEKGTKHFAGKYHHFLFLVAIFFYPFLLSLKYHQLDIRKQLCLRRKKNEIKIERTNLKLPLTCVWLDKLSKYCDRH